MSFGTEIFILSGLISAIAEVYVRHNQQRRSL